MKPFNGLRGSDIVVAIGGGFFKPFPRLFGSPFVSVLAWAQLSALLNGNLADLSCCLILPSERCPELCPACSIKEELPFAGYEKSLFVAWSAIVLAVDLLLTAYKFNVWKP